MKRSVWHILVRAHDHVWRDRAAAAILWELACSLTAYQDVEL
jgi:hypothetical protein